MHAGAGASRSSTSSVTAIAGGVGGWSLERRRHAGARRRRRRCHRYDTPPLLAALAVDVPITKQARYLLLSEPISERLLEPLVVSAERRFAAKQLGTAGARHRPRRGGRSGGGRPTVARARGRDRRRSSCRSSSSSPTRSLVEGFYDVTPDHQPMLGPVQGYDGLWLAAGFSGHGFMMAPAVGRHVPTACRRAATRRSTRSRSTASSAVPHSRAPDRLSEEGVMSPPQGGTTCRGRRTSRRRASDGRCRRLRCWRRGVGRRIRRRRRAGTGATRSSIDTSFVVQTIDPRACSSRRRRSP